MGEGNGLHNHTGPGPVVTTDPAAGLVHHHLKELGEHLHRVREAIESTRIRDPWIDTTTLTSGTPYKLKRRGYQHMRIWLPATATLTVDPGIGSYTMALTAGATVLDLPEGTEITTAAAINAIIELTDSNVGAAWHA